MGNIGVIVRGIGGIRRIASGIMRRILLLSTYIVWKRISRLSDIFFFGFPIGFQLGGDEVGDII